MNKSLPAILVVLFTGMFSLSVQSAPVVSPSVTAVPDSTASYIPFYASKILLTDSLSAGLSEQAKAIISRPFTPLPDAVTTLQQANVFTPLFTPLVFDAQIYHREIPSASPIKLYPSHYTNLQDYAYNKYVDSLMHSGKFAQLRAERQLVDDMRRLAFMQEMDHIHYTSDMLPGPIEYKNVEVASDLSLKIGKPKIQEAKAEELQKQVVDRVYWTRMLESTLQFAQNQISENWYKGGNNSLNLNMRTYLKVAYNKGRVNWTNELESKLGFFNSVNDPISKYRISDDLLRIVSNFGIKAFDRWYYTLDGQFRTQLLLNRGKDGNVVSKTFAPFIIDGGPGMRYEITKKFDDPFKKLNFSANISPISVTYIYTFSDDIDKSRIGLKPNERYKLRLGSTLRAMLNFDISQTINWQSRLFYNTSFKNIETEFENTLSFALTKYFSTRINVNLRFDDSMILPEKTFKKMLQYNELFSFGFAYKLN